MWQARSPLWGGGLRMALACLVLLTGWAAMLRGDDATSGKPATIQKTKDGLHFNIPPDWPIETRGGITAPIPLEEYLARKFKVLEAQMQSLEQRVNSLDVRLRVIEEEVKKQRQGPHSAERAGDSP